MAGLHTPTVIKIHFNDNSNFGFGEKLILMNFGDTCMNEFDAQSSHFNISDDGKSSLDIRFPGSKNRCLDTFNRFSLALQQTIYSHFTAIINIYELGIPQEFFIDVTLKRRNTQ